jgi:L-iditol 2-dehydrogenase
MTRQSARALVVTDACATPSRRSLLVGPGRTRIDITSPPSPGPNHILVQVLLNGLCASDLPTWTTGPRPGGAFTLGHEPVGRVMAVGAGVRTPSIGDLVTGRFPNSYTDHIVAHAEDAVIVPTGVPPESAIGEPLGCVVEALRRSRVDVGDRVAVVGLGFMGLCLLQLLAASAIGELVGIDTREESRAHGLAHGASHVYDPTEREAAAGMRGGFDVVFEVAGAQKALDLATTLTRSHGTLSIVGYHQAQRHVDMQEWNWKALDVVNGHVRDRRQLAESTKRGLDAVASGRVNYHSLITHRYPLSDIDQAFTDLTNKPTGFIKGVITLEDD